MVRGKANITAGYCPTWLVTDEGVRARPTTPAQVCLAAAQDWSGLLCEPSHAWANPLIKRWGDNMGHDLGTLDLSTCMQAHGIFRRLINAALGPGVVGCQCVKWGCGDIHVHGAESVRVSRWLLTWRDGTWAAALPHPCPGVPLVALSISGEDPSRWCAERWHDAATSDSAGYMVLVSACGERGAVCGPTTPTERADLIRRSRGSRPGPTFWKLAFLPLYPQWAQEAYWRLVDAQRGYGIVARRHKRGLQPNQPEPKGGYRPLTMLEETLKAVEGPTARRRSCASIAL